ncbi:MAG: DUF2398 family protein, partial [Actinobacteria bacterium]|nr:DUF2398 family protein [Actinomycetota bacterium]
EVELAYLRKNRRRIMTDIEQLTGATVQYHSEAMVLVTGKDLTGEQFPAGGSVAQAALLWGASMVDERDRSASSRVIDPPNPWFDVAAVAAADAWSDVVDRYRPRFSKDYQDNPEALRSAAEALLSRFGLVRRSETGAMQIHAALARFRPDEENIVPPAAVQDDFFGGLT